MSKATAAQKRTVLVHFKCYKSDICVSAHCEPCVNATEHWKVPLDRPENCALYEYKRMRIAPWESSENMDAALGKLLEN